MHILITRIIEMAMIVMMITKTMVFITNDDATYDTDNYKGYDHKDSTNDGDEHIPTQILTLTLKPLYRFDILTHHLYAMLPLTCVCAYVFGFGCVYIYFFYSKDCLLKVFCKKC